MVEPSMTYLPSPAEATAAAQRLASKASRQSSSQVTRPQGSSPARKGGWVAPVLLGSAAALGAAALYTAKMTRDAERKHPPIGRFLDVDGVRLHYIERGTGEPLVLIHGNGTLIQDFTINGLVDRLSERYRVIVIDRPGYGYSDRPRGLWTPRAHAALFEHALHQLGVEHAIVLGHSWGTMVAVSLALQAPALVRSLVLLSGYYFPTARIDVALNAPLALPGIGDALRHTISPPLSRLMLPAGIRAMFAPASVPERFDRLFPKELMVRPIQLRASMEDAALMTPSVMELEQHYRELKLPVLILTGGDDQIADVGRQSQRLHQEIPQSELIVLPGLGHMVHHLAPDQVIKAIDRAAELAGAAPRATYTQVRQPAGSQVHPELA
jgi:pimeloyl-ACP methyl ester carboxylesterase